MQTKQLQNTTLVNKPTKLILNKIKQTKQEKTDEHRLQLNQTNKQQIKHNTKENDKITQT